MYEYKVEEILSIYDGDTMTVVLDLGFGISSRQKLRLYGIDAPELRGEEREQGLITRDWLRQRINEAQTAGETIIVRSIRDKTGKYGRLLANVFIASEEKSLNEQMVDQGLAENY